MFYYFFTVYNMPCKRVTLKRYLARPSPPYHAGECRGKTMKGNSGLMYTSKPDKNGVYTWKRKTKKH